MLPFQAEATELTTREAAEVLLQWAHVVAGVFWIGLLYYFNVVQVPVFKKFDAATRSNAIQKLVPVALAWFRYTALLTVLFGIVLLYARYESYPGGIGEFMRTDGGVAITAGMTLGVIMFLNVWLVIWPNQRKIIEANVAKATAGKDIPPESAAWAKQAFYASRTNFVLSFPMLFFMVATQHLTALGGSKNQMLLMGAAILVAALVALWLATMKPVEAKPGTAPTTPPKP